MQIKKSELSDGIAQLTCDGLLNMVTAPRLKSAVQELVEQGTNRIVVDLNAISLLDSSGLGALISGLKTARQAGGDLRIAATGNQVLTVLRLTNLNRILQPYETADAAAREW